MQLSDLKNLSFAQKEDAKKSIYVLYFTLFNENKEQFYIFYGLSGDYLKEFQELMASPKPDFSQLSKYGEIIFFGKGEPTDEVKAIMQNEFNFNLDTIADPSAPASMVIIPVTPKDN